jgi:hypothetical protein
MAMKTPEVTPSALGAVVTALEVIVVLGTLKVLAIKYHQSPMAQAYLTLF